jgi:hypothetical protein
MDTASINIFGADLAFDAARHEYRLPSGVLVPSVTQILKAVGVATDFDEIAGRSQKLADAIDYKRALGTAAHADCHAYDDQDLEWSQVHPDVHPFVRAWETFRQNTGLTPMARERRVYHPGLGYCGTLDGVFLTKADRKVLVDIKLGDPFHAAAHLQTAAYLEAWNQERPFADDVVERWAVRLIPDRRVPYDITRYDDWRDTQKFRAVLTAYYEQPERRRRTA